MSRETFLERVRQAAQAGQAHRVRLHPVPDDVGYVGAQGDLCERFVAEVEAVGGMPHMVADLAGARSMLQELLAEISSGHAVNAVAAMGGEASGPTMALCWQHELLTRLELKELLQASGIQRLDYLTLAAMSPAKRRAAMLACQVGITSCDWAIAETGSLLLCSRTGRERVASLLPPIYIAIVERLQIVPDLIDAIAKLYRGGVSQLSSNAVLITGPSKTGDIELQLTTGVHGPGTWHVIVVQS